VKKKILALTLALALLIVTVIPVFADGPNFGTAIYVDGVAYGTKGTANIPAPNEHNQQSFDNLYRFENGQPAVAEAAPGDPDYNGGRWIAFDVTWNISPVPVTSYDQLMALENNGDVTITPTPEEDRYFQCPLLPAKEQ